MSNTDTDTLLVVLDTRDGSVSIVDPAGGVWWATEEAAERILDLPIELRVTEALRLMREDRDAGRWAD